MTVSILLPKRDFKGYLQHQKTSLLLRWRRIWELEETRTSHIVGILVEIDVLPGSPTVLALLKKTLELVFELKLQLNLRI